MADQLVTEPFSSGYELIHNATVHTFEQDEAIMDIDLFDALQAQFGEPVIGYVGGLHYHFKPERSIPPSALAVPERNHDDPQTLLVQR